MMAFSERSLDDYVDVAQRIADFREAYPHGSLQPADPARPWEQAVVQGYDKQGKQFAATMIVYVAAAYRTPDDPRPGIGVAWEPFPGRTPYTLGSELMNAETSAWGRAIVAVLASDIWPNVPIVDDPWLDQPAGVLPVPPEDEPGMIDPKDQRAIMAAAGKMERGERLAKFAAIIGRPVGSTNELSFQEGRLVRDKLKGAAK